jgi:putative membrane protein
MSGMMHDSMQAWMALWGLIGAAVLVLAVTATIWLIRRPGNAVEPDDREHPAMESPEEVLRRRYAAGEIDEDEYLKRMSGLQQPW